MAKVLGERMEFLFTYVYGYMLYTRNVFLPLEYIAKINLQKNST